MYDGDDADVNCGITTANQGLSCTVTFHINETVDGPLYVYYEMDKFYQNHRRYVSSLDYYQLNGQVSLLVFIFVAELNVICLYYLQHQSESDLKTTCIEYITNSNDQLINPCGLIANSMFNGMLFFIVCFVIACRLTVVCVVW